MRTRTRRSVGSPTAAVMRRTWRLRPSRMVIANQLVGTLLRKRTGGLRGHRAGSSICSTSAGRVGPSFSYTLDPDGVAVPVRLLPARADEIASLGELRVQSATGLFEILASAFAGHGKGAVLLIGAERRRVQHHRIRDPRRYKVLLDTVPA